MSEKDKQGWSQQELDSLFSKKKTGEDIEKELESKTKVKEKDEYRYKDVDFYRPDKFNNENIKSLRTICGMFAKNCSERMSGFIRQETKVTLTEEIDQQPYASEYVEKVPHNDYVFCVSELGNQELGSVIFMFDINMVRHIHRNNMGGRNVHFEYEPKPLSEIESLSLEEWISKVIYPAFKDAFEHIVEIRPHLIQTETDAHFTRITQPMDIVAVCTFDIKIDGQMSMMQLCIPFLSIEKILPKLNIENMSLLNFNQGSAVEQADRVKNHLKRAERRMEFEFGKAQISLGDLLKLKKGDHLILNRRKDEDMIAYVEDLPKMSCRPGIKDGRIAFEITGFAESEEEVDG